MAPVSRTIINQTHACGLTNILTNSPEFPGHGLVAVTGFFSYNLKKYNSVYMPCAYSLIIPFPLTYPAHVHIKCSKSNNSSSNNNNNNNNNSNNSNNKISNSNNSNSNSKDKNNNNNNNNSNDNNNKLD